VAVDVEPVRRRTRQLATVLAAVRASGVAHPTAERIFADVRRELPRISLGTVYRNLQRLAAEGVIGVTHPDGGPARFDPTPGGHDHFVCRTCGRLEDLPSSPPDAGRRAARQAGHAVTSHALVLYGACRDCRSEGAP
jgi:Fur family transcriptional regulator, peroxide stress response regulator